jgi:hypothetical protein
MTSDIITVEGHKDEYEIPQEVHESSNEKLIKSAQKIVGRYDSAGEKEFRLRSKGKNHAQRQAIEKGWVFHIQGEYNHGVLGRQGRESKITLCRSAFETTADHEATNACQTQEIAKKERDIITGRTLDDEQGISKSIHEGGYGELTEAAQSAVARDVETSDEVALSETTKEQQAGEITKIVRCCL